MRSSDGFHQSLTDGDWESLLFQIQNRSCVPFLGMGACCAAPAQSEVAAVASGLAAETASVATASNGPSAASGGLPVGGPLGGGSAIYRAYPELAEGYARSQKFPLREKTDLARVAQFCAFRLGPMIAKAKIAKLIEQMPPPDFSDANEPHRMLARLPLPLYVTTNYNNFMFEALKQEPLRSPRRDHCRWADHLVKSSESTVFEQGPPMDAANPVVYHLHGYAEKPQSMVITEDDYLDFVFNTAQDLSPRDVTSRGANDRTRDRIPLPVLEALQGASWLFLGYNLADWDFRVVLRSVLRPLAERNRITHMSVQITPSSVDETEAQLSELWDTLGKFLLEDLRLRVYWGSCAQFIHELLDRASAAGVSL